MDIKELTPDSLIDSLPEDRKIVMTRLRKTFGENLSPEFEETVSYGMITWVVPHTVYPAGYHCNPKQALPFLSIASQKNFVAIYHMGIYADPKLLEWFVAEWPKHTKMKLDMGKSCIRIKKFDDMPYDLFADLAKKMSASDWISIYEKNLRK